MQEEEAILKTKQVGIDKGGRSAHFPCSVRGAYKDVAAVMNLSVSTLS